MQKIVNMFATVLTVSLLYCAAAQHSKEIYTMDINERGSRFTESMTVDSKEETVVYVVPAHNELTESHVLVDYKTNTSATLMPKLKECYIRKLISNNKEPSLSETRRNMQLRQIVTEHNVTIPVETETNVMIKIREIQPGNLSQKVLEFCAGNRAYLVKDVPLEQVLAKRTRKEGSRLQKRANTERTYRFRVTPFDSNRQSFELRRMLEKDLDSAVYTCKRMKAYDSVLAGCAKDVDNDISREIKYACGPRPISCRYTALCKAIDDTGKPGGLPPDKKSTIVYVEIECKEKHNFNLFWCCDIVCV